MERIRSIDFTRGVAMVLMALDHTRDLMHVKSLTQNPTNLETTSPAVFLTRWITHFCAPTFVFLAGLSAYLFYKNKNNVDATRKFLLTRGVWLVILEFTLVNFAIFFDIHFSNVLFDVIATIGFGFIILSLFLKASLKTIAIIGLVIIFGHNLISFVPFPQNNVAATVVSFLFVPGGIPLSPHTTFIMAYPPIPWLGIMMTGFACGNLFNFSAGKRVRKFFIIGSTAILLFIILRFINIYGDPVPWSVQKNSMYTFLSFINITKYPPSLLFCLSMLGLMFIVLALSDGIKNRFSDFVIVYGRVPLFYFIVHFYVVHLLMFSMVYLQGFKTSQMVFGFNFGRPKEGSGISLLMVYFVWIAVVILLYPVCKWYGNYKMNHKEKTWLRYL